MQRFRIQSREVGHGAPAYVVAEVSANHNQSFDRAVAIIRAAKEAGADAVKLQTYTPDSLTIDSDQQWFQVPSTSLWAGKTLYQLYGEAFTPWEWHDQLFQVAAEEGLGCFSTPFDAAAVELLERLGSPAYKIASFENVDLQLLDRVGRTGKPVILSTGMASLQELREAVSTLRVAGAGAVALLKCTSAYPASPSSMNLRTIPHLREVFDTVVGLSDHTMGSIAAVTAVALGASIIEKHFTLARADGGADAAFSLEPQEFKRMVDDIRTAEQALGTVSYERTAEEQKSVVFRRSLFVVENVRQGDAFTDMNVRSIRPGYGIAPRHLAEILGKRARTDIARGTPLAWDLVAGGQ
jgi:pseudaminic acid synthase